MSLVRKDLFPNLNNDVVTEWMFNRLCEQACQEKSCMVCGEKVYRNKDFLWWRGDDDIILCVECAEHTLAGLNRDLAELKGYAHELPEKSIKYSPIWLLEFNKVLVERLEELKQSYLDSIDDFLTFSAELSKRNSNSAPDKRSYDKGHIRKRGKDSFQIFLSLGKNPKTGKYAQHTETIKGTKQQAEQRLSELKNDINKNQDIRWPSQLEKAQSRIDELSKEINLLRKGEKTDYKSLWLKAEAEKIELLNAGYARR